MLSPLLLQENQLKKGHTCSSNFISDQDLGYAQENLVYKHFFMELILLGVFWCIWDGQEAAQTVQAGPYQPQQEE